MWMRKFSEGSLRRSAVSMRWLIKRRMGTVTYLQAHLKTYRYKIENLIWTRHTADISNHDLRQAWSKQQVNKVSLVR